MASSTPTPTEGATPQPTATATPQPMTSPTEAPSPQPTAIPTPREFAAARLAGFIPWINVPHDAAHEQAAEVLTNISIASTSLGDHLVQLEWVADSVTDGEARTLGVLGDIVVRDLGLADHMAYLPWITDGIASDEIAALLLLADKSFDSGVGKIASEILLGGERSERDGNLGDGVDCISRQKRCAGSIPYLKFAVGSKRHHAEGDRRSRSLRSITATDPDTAYILLGYPWLVLAFNFAAVETLYGLARTGTADPALLRRLASRSHSGSVTSSPALTMSTISSVPCP